MNSGEKKKGKNESYEIEGEEMKAELGIFHDSPFHPLFDGFTIGWEYKFQ